MTMQHESRAHGLANNLWAQLALTAVVAAIVIALAWAYVW